MKREVYSQLLEWKLRVNRKPLVMYGARQVGKTYIIKEFGKNEFTKNAKTGWWGWLPCNVSWHFPLCAGGAMAVTYG